MEIVLATRNRAKVRELTAMLRRHGFAHDVLSLHDFPAIGEIREEGRTFGENAVRKAVAVAQATGKFALADDSGLEVDALAGRPGIFSARFAGENATDAENNGKLLALLRDIPERRRGARFVCSIALANPEKVIDVVEGTCAGIVVAKERGSGGFGYDPLFQPLEYHKTFAELAPSIKSRISHRARAMEKAVMVLEKYIYGIENPASRPADSDSGATSRGSRE